jgi:hypothetical protein
MVLHHCIVMEFDVAFLGVNGHRQGGSYEHRIGKVDGVPGISTFELCINM